MYRDITIATVVPAYNEERHIAQVITTMPAFVDHIIVINDASSDRTSEVARATEDPRLVLIEHTVNTGVGGAVVDGHRRALELGAGIICIMAGDAQTDPAYLESLVEPVADGRCDMAKANRFFSSQSYAGMPRYRVFGNVVLSFLNKLASGFWHIFDPQNGYLAVRREVLEAVPLDSIAKGYSLENDFLINLNILGARVTDVPVPAVYADEQSSIKLRRVVPQMVSLLFRGFFRRIIRKYVLWSFSPVALFLFTGLALCFFGVVVGAWTIAQTLGPPEASTATVLLSVGPLLVGINLLVSALMLDIQEGQKLEVQLDRFGGHASRQRMQNHLQARAAIQANGDGGREPADADAIPGRGADAGA
jgi:glycosyltransferase involved in cell wall biosynthesis